MKGDFVIKFIEAIVETGKEMHDMWHWEPLYYKGIRVKGRDYNDFRKAYKARNVMRRINHGRNYRTIKNKILE